MCMIKFSYRLFDMQIHSMKHVDILYIKLFQNILTLLDMLICGFVDSAIYQKVTTAGHVTPL